MEFNLLKGKFTEEQAKFLNPLVLALIGDGVYEVFIRTYLVEKNRDMNVHKIHLKTVAHVKAEAQSKFMKIIIDELNEDELSIFKRGRNTKSSTPKNADVADYRWATGFEALMGYLYVLDKSDRLNYLLNKIMEGGDNNES
ncbi:ribonuclease III domain-containing protein [Clostridium sp.]|uniref:Mini-ribonuclease 3 n=1 Tax=Clostridium sp. TaxID=1506 RepID=UPI002FCA542D